MPKVRTQIFEESVEDPEVGGLLEVSEENLHHLRDVLRVKNGDLLRIVINSKEVALAEVILEKKRIYAKISEIKEIERVINPITTLCFAVCKSAQNELVAEKATELGVENILFWRSEHTGIKVNEKEFAAKTVRLKKIAEGAARQSKQLFIPQIFMKNSLSEALSFVQSSYGGVLIYAALEDNARYVHQIEALKNRSDQQLHIFIGPEGGFSERERSFLQKTALPLSLGSSVLKAETAAIVAISQLQAFCRISETSL